MDPIAIWSIITSTFALFIFLIVLIIFGYDKLKRK